MFFFPFFHFCFVKLLFSINVQRNAIDLNLCTYTAYHFFCYCFCITLLFLMALPWMGLVGKDTSRIAEQRWCIQKGHCHHQQKLQVRTISQISLLQHSKPSDLLSNSSQVSEPFKAMIPDIYEKNCFSYSHVFIALSPRDSCCNDLFDCMPTMFWVGWSPGNCLG